MGCGNVLSGPNSNHRLETTINRPSDPVSKFSRFNRLSPEPHGPSYSICSGTWELRNWILRVPEGGNLGSAWFVFRAGNQENHGNRDMKCWKPPLQNTMNSSPLRDQQAHAIHAKQFFFFFFGGGICSVSRLWVFICEAMLVCASTQVQGAKLISSILTKPVSV